MLNLKSITGIAAVLLMFTVSVHADDIRIQGGGSSFVKPMMDRWVTEYQRLHPEVKIDYTGNGSGGGIKGITDKTFDFGASDAPLNKKEKEKMGGAEKIAEFPVIAGAVVAAYNLPGFQGDLKLDGAVLADIYLGNVKAWNDPRIAALNPGAALPALPITPMHRTDGSGTTYVFTSYLSTQSEDFKNKVGGAKSVEWPPAAGGAGGPQNAGVAALVQSTRGAIGYIELTYALQTNIPFAVMKNKDGEFVKASADSVSLAGESAVATMKPGHLTVNIWNLPGKQSYPIAAFTYVIVYKELDYVKEPQKAHAMAEFFKWVAADGQKLAPPLNFSPLSVGVQQQVEAEIKTLTWSGQPVLPVK